MVRSAIRSRHGDKAYRVNLVIGSINVTRGT